MEKKYCIFSLIFFCLILAGCKNKTVSAEKTAQEILLHKNASQLHEYILQQNELKKKAVENYIKDLSLQEKICQLFIENINGNVSFEPVEKMSSICQEDSSFVIPGGYLFFSYNLQESPEQVMEFTDSISEYCEKNNKIMPYLSLDQEGGLVNRLKNLSGAFPSPALIAEEFNLNQAKDLFLLQAKQMKLLGFNLNFAPVAEACDSYNKDFLMNRSFGPLEKTVSFGSCFVDSFENCGVGTVLKHFPGNSNQDPHTGLPMINLSKEQLEQSLQSFYRIMEKNPSAVLMSHAKTSAIDNEVPACLSYIWVTEILREKAGYKGLIFSDDIFMGALSQNGYPPEKAVVMAVEAGIDCIMISEKKLSKGAEILYKKALEDEAFSRRIDESIERIIRFKLNNKILCYVPFQTQNESGNTITCYKIQNYENPEPRKERCRKFNENYKLNQKLVLEVTGQ